MNRNDFEMLANNVVYFDNGATTLKPKCVKEAICKYYTEYTANAHRGDYKNSAIVDSLYEGTREKSYFYYYGGIQDMKEYGLTKEEYLEKINK